MTLHVLHVEGKSLTGLHGEATQVAAGLGVELGAGVRLSDHVALQLAGLFDWILPEEDFLLHGHTILTVNGAHFGVSTGLSFAAP